MRMRGYLLLHRYMTNSARRKAHLWYRLSPFPRRQRLPMGRMASKQHHGHEAAGVVDVVASAGTEEAIVVVSVVSTAVANVEVAGTAETVNGDHIAAAVSEAHIEVQAREDHTEAMVSGATIAEEGRMASGGVLTVNTVDVDAAEDAVSAGIWILIRTLTCFARELFRITRRQCCYRVMISLHYADVLEGKKET